jgi:hypothetical protein
VDRLNALIEQVGDDETHPLAGTLDRMGELIEEFEHQHIHELIENYGFARAVDSPRWKGPGKLLAIAGIVLTGVGALLWFPKTRRT